MNSSSSTESIDDESSAASQPASVSRFQVSTCGNAAAERRIRKTMPRGFGAAFLSLARAVLLMKRRAGVLRVTARVRQNSISAVLYALMYNAKAPCRTCRLDTVQTFHPLRITLRILCLPRKREGGK
jgi:hypothetical protein